MGTGYGVIAREAIRRSCSRKGSDLRHRGVEAKQKVDLRPSLDEIVDRIFGQHVEEGVERLAQRRVQAAAVNKRTFDGAVLETFRHGEAVFGDPDHIEQADLFGRLAKPHAAIAAANCFHQAGLVERLEDLEQEQLGNAIGLGNLRNAAQMAL